MTLWALVRMRGLCHWKVYGEDGCLHEQVNYREIGKEKGRR